MSEHFIHKCAHGTVMGKCRCLGVKSDHIIGCSPPCVHAERVEVSTLVATFGPVSYEDRITQLENDLAALRMEFDKLKAELTSMTFYTEPRPSIDPRFYIEHTESKVQCPVVTWTGDKITFEEPTND